MKYFKLLLILCLFYPSIASGKLFQNSYVSFELPPNWDCAQEGFEHVCVNNFSKKPKEAIIILTAKIRGDHDSLTQYEAHLKTPREMINYKGTKFISKIKSVKKRNISQTPWVDGVHLSSEVENYYTRYLATVKGEIGMLVTFSAHKDHYTKYANDFIRAIKSLKVIASKELLAGGLKSGGRLRNRNNDIFAGTGGYMPDGTSGDYYGEGGESGSGGLFGIFSALGTKGLIGLILILLAGAGFYIYQKTQ